MKTPIVAAAAAVLAFCGCKQKSESPAAAVAPPAVQAEPNPVAAAPIDSKKPENSADNPLGLGHDDRGNTNHLARAKDLKAIGEHEAALLEVRRALYDDRDDDEALELAARLGQVTRRPQIAVIALERLAQLYPEDPQPLIRAARIEVADGKIADALRLANAAKERDSDNPDVYQLIGRSELAQGDLTGAIGSFKKAIALAPDHGYALNNLGYAYLRANMNDEAVEVLEDAVEILPNIAYVHNNLGVAYERVGREEEAEVEYTKSATLSPKYVKAQINSARVKRLASAGKAPTPSDIDEK